MGVVVIVRRYIDIFPTPLDSCISSFLGSSIPTLFMLKMCFGLFYILSR